MDVKARYFNRYIETASRKEIEQLQWVKLKRLLEYVYAHSPFYRERLDRHGAQPDKIRNLEDFRRKVPLIRKQDLLEDQQTYPPYGRRLCVQPEDIAQVCLTGGTSGKGQEVLGQTVRDAVMTSLTYAAGCYWAGLQRDDVLANTFPVGTSGGGLWLYGGFWRKNLNLFQLGPYSTTVKLQYMKRFNVTVLVSTPSYLIHLKSVAEKELGWNVRNDLNIRTILTATETYSLERAREIEEGYGAKLYEWYASTARLFTWTCEYGAVYKGKRGMLHSFPHVMLVETIDPETQEPVEYGEYGEVVITYLDCEASPLLRYATGDRAKLLPGESCPCGRHFDGFECGSISRYDDMLKVRGVNFWPNMTDDVIFKNPEVENYSGVVRTAESGEEELIVSVEFKSHVAAEDREKILRRIEKDLREAIGLRMEAQEVEKIPVASDFQQKARRWRDERRK